MTFKKFKKEFEACERGQAYSGDFKDILGRVLTAFQYKSFENGSSNHYIGDSIENIHFSYFGENSLFLVAEKIFNSLLNEIDDNEKLLILAYCYCKFLDVEFLDDQICALCCTPDELNGFLSVYGELYHFNDKCCNMETGEIFKEFNYRLEPEFITHARFGTNCNLHYKNAKLLR